jgi:hypothetical protein
LFVCQYSYGLDGPDSIPGSERCSLLYSVQTDLGAHPVSCPMGAGVIAAGACSRLLTPLSAEIKKGGAIRPLPHMSS